MRNAPLGMLVTYTHIIPRDDCPIQKVMSLDCIALTTLGGNELVLQMSWQMAAVFSMLHRRSLSKNSSAAVISQSGLDPRASCGVRDISSGCW